MLLRQVILPALISACCAGCSPAPIVSQAERARALAELESQVDAEPAQRLEERIGRVLESNLENRLLNSESNAAWQIMHGVICYGDDLPIQTPDSGVVSVLDYAFKGGELRGFDLMSGSEVLPTTGRIGMKAALDPGGYVGQGHVDQWIAILAMADIPRDREILVDDRRFTVEDFARQAQYDVPRNLFDEYSWTLIATTHYFPDEPRWRVAGGMETSWEMMVERELTHDINLSPCGGTHRLAGLVRAIHAKERLKLPDTPTWKSAKELVRQLLQNAKENRGVDGRLSSHYFIRPGSTADRLQELSSSGHVFEFVALASTDAELVEPWVELSANRLCQLLEDAAELDLDCGGLYHALSGLRIYYDRRFAD